MFNDHNGGVYSVDVSVHIRCLSHSLCILYNWYILYCINRFLQKRFLYIPPTTTSTTTTSSTSSSCAYLNLNPTQSVNSNAITCFHSPAQGCEQVVDLVYYSKDENLTDYTQYDWLITADPT